MSVYITSARRAYEIADHYRARGAYVVLGGLHVTSLPDEAAAHADTVFIGPGEGTWPEFLRRPPRRPARRRYYAARTAHASTGHPARASRPDRAATATCARTRSWSPAAARTTATSATRTPSTRAAGRSTRRRSTTALAEIDRLPGRHLYFLDDHLFGNRRFAGRCSTGMRGMGRLFQGGRHRRLRPRGDLIERAAAAGHAQRVRRLRDAQPRRTSPRTRKRQNLGRDYDAAIRRLHDLGVMVNGSFVFGLDDDGPDVFDRTVEWAISRRAGDRDVPHHDAVSGHRPAPSDRGDGRIAHRRLGPLRHPPRGLPAEADDAASSSKPATGGRTATSTAGRSIWRGAAAQDTLTRRGAPPRLRRRLEEVRAAVGSHHPCAARQRDAAGLGANARCVHRSEKEGPRSARHERSRANRPLDGLVSASGPRAIVEQEGTT